MTGLTEKSDGLLRFIVRYPENKQVIVRWVACDIHKLAIVHDVERGFYPVRIRDLYAASRA